MKKISLFFALLISLIATNAWGAVISDPTALKSNKVYTISTKNRGSVYWNGSATQLGGTMRDAVTFDATNPNHQFMFYKKDGETKKYYMISVGSEKFVSKSGTNAALVDRPTQVWTIKTSGNSSYPLMIDSQDGNHWNFNGGKAIEISSWSSADDGNRLAINEVGDADAELVTKIKNMFKKVTYNYSLNDNIVKTEIFTVVTSDARPNPTLPYACTADLSGVPATITTDGTYTIPVTVSGFPFEFSTDFQSAKWYTWKMANRVGGTATYKGYVWYNGTKYQQTDNDSQPADDAKYLYAFIGNPFSFTIMAADGRFVYSNCGNNADVVRAEAGTAFTALKSNQSSGWTGYSHYFYLNAVGVGGSVNEMDKGEGFRKVGYWTGGGINDVGSLVAIEAVSDVSYKVVFAAGAPANGKVSYNGYEITPSSNTLAFAGPTTLTTSDLTVTEVEGYTGKVSSISNRVITITYSLNKSAAWAALNDKIVEAKAVVLPGEEGPWGTNPGYYNQAGVQALPGAITTAEGVLESTTTDDVYEAATTTLTAAIKAAKVIMPEVGKTYLIVSALANYETQQGVKKAIYENGENMSWTSLNTAEKKFYFGVAGVDASGRIAFQSVLNNKYFAACTGSPVAAQNDINYVEMFPLGSGQFNLRPIGSSNPMHTNGHSGGSGVSGELTNWEGGVGSASAWYVTEAAVPTTVDITYEVKRNEELLWSKTVKAEVGKPYPTVENPNSFVTLGGFPEGNVTVSETKQLTYTTRYAVATAPANVETWYAIDIHGNQAHAGVPLYYNNETYLRCEFIDDNTAPDDFKNGAVKSDNYFWAFIGNPFQSVKLYNKGGKLYAYQPSDGDVKIEMSATGSDFQVCNTTSGLANSFALKVADRGNYFNHRQTYIQGWTSADGGSSLRAYEITPATVADAVEYTMGADYGTLIVPFYAEIPEDVEVYTCSALSGNVLTLTAETSMIKPGVPYIIKSEEFSEFEFLGGSKLTTPTTATVGLLTGVYENTGLLSVITAAGSTNTAYVLTKVGEKAAFQYIDPEDYPTGAQVGANRCYLLQPKGGEVKATLYFDEETGINNVDVDANVDGKFLENGRIVIVKNNAKYNVAGQSLK